MIVKKQVLREIIQQSIESARDQGKNVYGIDEEFDRVPDSFDALIEFSEKLTRLSYRDNWSYVEPDTFEEIRNEWHKDADPQPRDVPDSESRIKNAFLSRVCGCMLGKPVEVDPTLAELKKAGEQCGQWPIADYISKEFLKKLGRKNSDECAKDIMRYAVPDDDINYTILGMLMLEEHGKGFTKENQRKLWMMNLAPLWTFGPERNILAKSILHDIENYEQKSSEPEFHDWLVRLNPSSELCGALIRVDAYGYACAGNPAFAAELAFKDASLTHMKTGVYGAMYIAAAIALAPVEKDLLTVMKRALYYVPQKSRFAEITHDCIEKVEKAGSWMDAYEDINSEYGKYTHCKIYQETGHLINSLHFSDSPHDAFCKQVMQGNDTDSFGATAGSISGMFYGKGSLDEKWLTPLKNTIRTSLADFHEQDLNRLAERMGCLSTLLKE